MSLTLQPGNSFTVVRQIPNHLDVATYYVQAVIRNAYTDVILATLQLTDKGGQRFKKDWTVPNDTSGQGFYISIVTSVYTDSGYTTKSENYGDDENTLLVQERVYLQGLGGTGMGGGGGVDAFDVRRIMQEELDKFKELLDEKDKLKEQTESESEITEPESVPEPMRWEEVLSAISGIQSFLDKESAKEDDYTPVLEKLDAVLQAVDDKEITEASDIVDPLASKIDEHIDTAEINHDEVKSLISDLEQSLTHNLSEIVTEAIQSAQFTTQLVTHVIPATKEDLPGKKAKKFDISNLHRS